MRCVFLLAFACPAAAFMAPATMQRQLLAGSPGLQMTLDKGAINRRQAMVSVGALLAPLVVPAPASAGDDWTTTSSGLKYSVLVNGPGPGRAKVGDLVAVRFKGSYQGNVFDDIFQTPEPLYYRVGAGTLIAGVDEAVLLMKTGDKLALQIPGNLAFGKSGRKASAGKPRIPADATIDFELELVFVPGKDEEILELTGGSEGEEPPQL